MPYDTVMVTDFADLECEASAKSVAVCATREQQRKNRFKAHALVGQQRNRYEPTGKNKQIERRI